MVIYSKLWINDAEGPIDVNFGISFLIGCIYVYMLSCSVMFDFLWPHGLYTAKLPCPWDSPSKNTAVGSHLLLQEEETQELNPGTDSGTESRSSALQADSLQSEPLGKPTLWFINLNHPY